MKIVTLLLISALLVCTAYSQAYLPGSYPGNSFRSGLYRNFPTGDSLSNKKWSVSKYGGISTSFIGWKGGSASVFSAPIGLQLNRRLNNNLYAFAGVSIAPTYINFNQSFLNAGSKFLQGNSLMYRPNGFGMYQRAEMGLMYTNDEHTFQISGSIGMERSQFPQAGNFRSVNRNTTQPLIK